MEKQEKTVKFRKDRSAGYVANHMARLFAQRLHERIRPLGLGPAQFPVILELRENEGLTQKELVERLDIEQATMANTLKRMERDGFVRRFPHPDDGRAQIVRLTPKGRRALEPAVAEAASVNEAAFAGFDPAERERFIEMMNRVVVALRRER